MRRKRIKRTPSPPHPPLSSPRKDKLLSFVQGEKRVRERGNVEFKDSRIEKMKVKAKVYYFPCEFFRPRPPPASFLGLKINK
jgi:hypothetical protein